MRDIVYTVWACVMVCCCGTCGFVLSRVVLWYVSLWTSGVCTVCVTTWQTGTSSFVVTMSADATLRLSLRCSVLPRVRSLCV